MSPQGADSGAVTVTIENIAEFPIGDSGVFSTPDGADEPGPALPGSSYSFAVTAAPGQRLSFATMLVQSNDWFLAPMPEGIALYDDGAPISGDVTDRIHVFDAGTEADQPFGEGADQAPRQSDPDTGADDPDDTVRLLGERHAGDYVGVVVESQGDGVFRVTVNNESAMATVPSPLAPGVFAAHTEEVALFELGQADPGYGLEPLAEDGDAAALGEFLAGITGTTTPLAPGAYAAHGDTVALYGLGGTDAGLGLEALAEDGDPTGLAAALAGLEAVGHSGAFDTPVGADQPGPLLPGGSYTFEVPIVDGERLSFATMFVQSNDWIIATPGDGLDLSAIEGDISDQLLVVDVGTEIDQTPGLGADQAPRQSGPDAGADDPDTEVRLVEGRSAERYVRVTVER